MVAHGAKRFLAHDIMLKPKQSYKSVAWTYVITTAYAKRLWGVSKYGSQNALS
jgi:hypothetical protein